MVQPWLHWPVLSHCPEVPHAVPWGALGCWH